LPFAGLRVVDFTSFWAGPSATNLLAALGADVVHVESIQHPDGYRFITMRTTDLPEHWWERSVGFQSENWNKRGITLDLHQEEGRERFLDLVALADVVVENYAPRVLDNVGISVASIHARNPEAVVLRMPAFGLAGPWRDRTGFASTMEAASGIAWMTGYADGPPTTLRAPLDPASGMHAVFAVISALYERTRSGRGHVLEVPMIECALNLASELVIEQSAYGTSLRRDGNRGPGAAPQGVYACRGEEEWLAIAVEADDQWRALRKALDEPEWSADPTYDSAGGRRRAHDAIDGALGAWAATVDVHTAVELLLGHGVPAAPVVDGLTLLANPQLQFRGYFESIDSPLLGRHHVRSLPFRFSSRTEPWIRRPAPTLGEHTREVLAEYLGLDDTALDRLEADEVIGTRPKGV
jgi:crotonobetainyl-CoA:carnitine CoA-transferase CaiB-like acyl-CoA transferase